MRYIKEEGNRESWTADLTTVVPIAAVTTVPVYRYTRYRISLHILHPHPFPLSLCEKGGPLFIVLIRPCRKDSSKVCLSGWVKKHAVLAKSQSAAAPTTTATARYCR